ncbi:MAG: preprotein translocase subunit SecG [Actinomycetia bacterium]|nr:preprotein translocase subunit SecG [Actinomycetes bacterium]
MLMLFVIIHSIVSLGLIFAILLHSGKGAGLSSAFGGGIPSALGGTGVIEKNLDRITIALSIVFGMTSVILIFLA